VYADTISDLGLAHELANYGEYSGAPSTEHTFEYAKTLIGLMTREKDPRGKIFIIGGSIANFTDVAATFSGLIKAIRAYQDVLRSHNVGTCLFVVIRFIMIRFLKPAKKQILTDNFAIHRSRFGSDEPVRIIKKACR
jgi:succinyl-CoA synthetase beta subunit